MDSNIEFKADVNPRIYILHEHKDQKLYEMFENELRGRGYHILLEQNYYETFRTPEDIINNITESDCTILLVTKNGISSDIFRRDIEVVREYIHNSETSKLLFPIVSNEVEVPPVLENIRLYKFDENKLDSKIIYSLVDKIVYSLKDLAKNNKTEGNLNLYSEGEKVKQLQMALKKLDFFKGTVDGVFGPSTLAAVNIFQKLNKFHITPEVSNDLFNIIIKKSKEYKGFNLRTNVRNKWILKTGNNKIDPENNLGSELDFTLPDTESEVSQTQSIINNINEQDIALVYNSTQKVIDCEIQFVEVIRNNSIKIKVIETISPAIPLSKISRILKIEEFEKSEVLFRLTDELYEALNNIKEPAKTRSHKKNKPESENNSLHLRSLKGRLLSDQSTDSDLLGYTVYSTAISELIRSNVDESDQNNTLNPNDGKAGKPFNIGIIAPWGHGKTTLMKNIQKELDPKFQSAEDKIKPKEKRNEQKVTDKETTYGQVFNYLNEKNLGTENIKQTFPTVWFNAWRYQSSEQIWAGLGHAIITQLSSRLSLVEQEKFWFKLQLRRIDVLKIRQEFISDILKKLIPYIIISIVLFLFSIIFIIVSFWSSITIFSIGIITPLIKWRTLVKDKIDGKLTIHFNEPDYTGKLGTYHEIIQDLHKVFTVLLKDNQRAVIFIDDLDRCSPTVIGEVFEAVNLMMIDPIIGNHCYFIFGMDAQVVAAALDSKYSLMSGKLKEKEELFGSVGWYFLDKFIQLPFNIPIMSREERLNFLKYYFDDKKELLKQDKNPQSEDILTKDSIESVKSVMQGTNLKNKQEVLSQIFEKLDTKIKLDVAREAVKEKLKDEDSENIVAQLSFICSFLNSSPREIIRYINLLRFYNSTLFIRQSMFPDSEPISFKDVAKYLLITLKWPQMVRWIQWEGDDDLVLYNTTTEKARFLDNLINSFIKSNKKLITNYSKSKKSLKQNESEFRKTTEDLYMKWIIHCDNGTKINGDAPGKKLPWIYDKQIMEVFIQEETISASFEKALLSKMW